MSEDRDILSPDQIAVLLKPINRNRVGHKQGQSHVEAYDIRAHLTRMFGFGNWDFVMLATDLLFDQARELKNKKPGCYVAYRVTIRIIVRSRRGTPVAEYDGTAVGSASMPDYMRAEAHDMAVKTAESQALKRAAINLGDQFGLSLYNGGSTEALVRKVVGMDDTNIIEDSLVIQPEQHDVRISDDDCVELDQQDDPVEPEQSSESEGLVMAFVSDAQIRKIQTLFGTLGIRDRAEKLQYLQATIGRNISSSKEMTKAEAHMVIEKMEGAPK